MNAAKQERKLYLDVLRIFAAFLVCYNHSFAFELYLGQDPDGSLISWFNVATSVLATISMPLFFMLSGALLLGKEESYKDLLSKRVWRFFVLLAGASAVTYLTLGPRPLSISAFWKDLIGGNIYMTYWFLYAYLSLLLAKPLLQKIAAHLTGKEVIYLLALRMIFFSGKMLLDGSRSLMALAPVYLAREFELPFSSLEILFYPLIGYYLSAKLPMEKIGWKEVLGCIAVVLLGTGITSVLVYAEGRFLGFTQNYTTLFNYCSAMAIFILVRYGLERWKEPAWLRRGIVGISKVTIGIYVLEPLLDHYFYEPFHRGMPWTQNAVVGYSLCWCLICMVLCGGLTYLLRQLPGIKHYL